MPQRYAFFHLMCYLFLFQFLIFLPFRRIYQPKILLKFHNFIYCLSSSPTMINTWGRSVKRNHPHVSCCFPHTHGRGKLLTMTEEVWARGLVGIEPQWEYWPLEIISDHVGHPHLWVSLFSTPCRIRIQKTVGHWKSFSSQIDHPHRNKTLLWN